MMVAVAQMQHAPIPPCPKCGRIGLPRGKDGVYDGVAFCPWHDLYSGGNLIVLGPNVRQMGPTVEERCNEGCKHWVEK
jgi:hypothetical protein